VPHTAERSAVVSSRSSISAQLTIGLLGCGQIGRAVAAAAPALGIRCAAALVRDPHKHPDAQVPLHTDGRLVLDAGIDVLVEVLGGLEPARTLIAAALDKGIPVVTANKSLMAAHGPELRARAALAGVPLLYDAAVVAGVPFVGALASRPALASVTSIIGILNGTSHAIATAIEQGTSFDAALADAQARGYAEPDSSADVSGRDAAEKLTILLQLCGLTEAAVADLTRQGIDTLDPRDFAAARALGGSIKPVAAASLLPERSGSWVGPAFVRGSHLFSQLSGVTNGLELATTVGDPVTFIGPGAGPAVTAATILDDVVQAARTSYGDLSRSHDVLRQADTPLPASLIRGVPASSWFLRVSADAHSGEAASTTASGALALAHLAEFLAARAVAAARIEQIDDDFGVLTVDAPHRAAADAAEALRAIGHRVVLYPVIGGASRGAR